MESVLAVLAGGLLGVIVFPILLFGPIYLLVGITKIWDYFTK